MLIVFTVPILAVYQQELMPPEWRATMSSASAMATGLGNAGIALGGYLITAWGYSSLFLTAAGLSTVGAALFWVYTWMPSRTLVRRSDVHTAM
jgi:predicted MFS family arabinose efflux permease